VTSYVGSNKLAVLMLYLTLVTLAFGLLKLLQCILKGSLPEKLEKTG